MISSTSQHSGSFLKTFSPECTRVNKGLLPLFQQAANGPTGRGGPVTISNLCGDGGQDTVDTWNTYNQPHEIPTTNGGHPERSKASHSSFVRSKACWKSLWVHWMLIICSLTCKD